MRQSILLFSLVLAVCFASSVASSPDAQVVERRNIRHEQWTYFRRVSKPAHWNGLWSRVHANGSVKVDSQVRRSFSYPDDTKVLQTNTYFSNRIWPTPKRYFLYVDDDPLPQYGFAALANGTAVSGPQPGFWGFTPSTWGLWTGTNVSAPDPFFGVATYYRHPFLDVVRATPRFVYILGQLDYVNIVREVQYPFRYPAFGYSWDKTATPLVKGHDPDYVSLPGSWLLVNDCITRRFVYKRTTKLVTDYKAYFPIGSGRVALKYPDGFRISIPRTVGPQRYGKFTTFYTHWEVDDRTSFLGTTLYRDDGGFMRACIAIGYKM